MMPFALSLALALAGAYLFGSFPSALIAGHLARGIDIRRHGSGNAGATNTLRVLGKGWAVAVLCVDLEKGALAVLLAGYFSPEAGDSVRVAAGFSVVVGHVFPLFSAFRGGKGVAPAAGMLTALFPPLAPVCALVFAGVLAVWKKASLASLVTAVVLPFVYVLLSAAVFRVFSFWIFGLCSIITVVVVYMHRSNIRRLRDGSEPDVGAP